MKLTWVYLILLALILSACQMSDITTKTAFPQPSQILFPPTRSPTSIVFTQVPQGIDTPFIPPKTPTTTPAYPTPPPLVPKVQLEALTLFSGSTGWAMQSFLTPLPTQYNYNVERKILHTTQGFLGWQDVSPPSFNEKAEISKVFFLNVNTAVLIFYQSFLPDQAATELTGVRTIDGGQTWQIGNTMRFDCCLRRPVEVEMLDANQGWMMAVDDAAMGTASLAFFRTTDGGLNWDKVYDSIDVFKTDPSNVLYAVRNPFGNNGFALLDFNDAFFATGRLYRSEDGGKSWQQVSVPIPPATSDLETQAGMGKREPAITIPQFWTEHDGVMVGRYYTQLEIPPSKPTVLPVSEFLYFTHDGGLTWTYSRSPASTGSPYFLDANNGWYLGKSDPDPTTSTQLYKTTDGGRTWVKVLPDCPLPLGSMIHFVDSQIGYSVKASFSYDNLFDARASEKPPYFFFTQDGGLTWEKVEPKVSP
jgi:photosystem II stability/assembly factor-like uncharacterized protein